MESTKYLQRVWLLSTIILSFLSSLITCNVEKTIFVAPASITLPSDASIDNLLLIALNANHRSVRTYINATFPTAQRQKGSESWFLLEGLTPGQRYEVRVCWLATQPTAFWLYTHSLSTTFETPELISSLTSFVNARHHSLTKEQIKHLQTRRYYIDDTSSRSSLLFLQIHAAADYYSLDEKLMKSVPPVLVDIILDPYLLNIFPQSLAPTFVYITSIAVIAWFLSAWIKTYLQRLSSSRQQVTKDLRDSDSNLKKSQ